MDKVYGAAARSPGDGSEDDGGDDDSDLDNFFKVRKIASSASGFTADGGAPRPGGMLLDN